MQIFACLQVRARTSVGYGENSTALNITLSAEGQTGKNKNVSIGLTHQLIHLICYKMNESGNQQCKGKQQNI